jgi:RimJ/RimL family protein N-acetyltransferase
LPVKAWRLYRQTGLAGVYRRIRSLTWWSLDYVVFRKDLEPGPPDVEKENLSFRVARPEDIPWMSREMHHLAADRAERLLRQQFSEEDLTILGVSKDAEQRLVFTVWVSHKGLDLRALAEHVQPGDLSMRRAWVPERARRRGLATRGMRFAEEAARQAGVKRLWSLVLTDNVASLRLHRRLGYEERGRVRLVKRFGKCYTRCRLREDDRWTTRRVPEDVSGL